jgi:hypothetical protein
MQPTLAELAAAYRAALSKLSVEDRNAVIEYIVALKQRAEATGRESGYAEHFYHSRGHDMGG